MTTVRAPRAPRKPRAPRAPKPIGPSESKIQSWILAQLRDIYPEGLWERQNVVVAQAKDRFIRAGTVGQADLRGCFYGRYIELEVKRPGELQTPAQVQRQKDVEAAGGLYAVVHDKKEAFAAVKPIRDAVIAAMILQPMVKRK